jgi:hypothetical protein
MKKLFLLPVVFVLCGAGAFAQFNILSYPPPVEGGDLQIDVGIGITRPGSYGKIVVPPLRVSIEYDLPVKVPISVGGLVAYHRVKYETVSGDTAWNNLGILARANWHWGFPVSWLDFYTGITMGYMGSFATGYNASWYGGAYNPFEIGAQAGAHFYFTKNIGAFAEFGYPYWINAGLALKF